MLEIALGHKPAFFKLIAAAIKNNNRPQAIWSRPVRNHRSAGSCRAAEQPEPCLPG